MYDYGVRFSLIGLKCLGRHCIDSENMIYINGEFDNANVEFSICSEKELDESEIENRIEDCLRKICFCFDTSFEISEKCIWRKGENSSQLYSELDGRFIVAAELCESNQEQVKKTIRKISMCDKGLKLACNYYSDALRKETVDKVAAFLCIAKSIEALKADFQDGFIEKRKKENFQAKDVVNMLQQLKTYLDNMDEPLLTEELNDIIKILYSRVRVSTEDMIENMLVNVRNGDDEDDEFHELLKVYKLRNKESHPTRKVNQIEKCIINNYSIYRNVTKKLIDKLLENEK